MNPYHCQTRNRRSSHIKTVFGILSLVVFMTVAAVSVRVRSDEKVLHKTLRGVEVGDGGIHGP